MKRGDKPDGGRRTVVLAAIGIGAGLLVWMERRRRLRPAPKSMAGREGERVVTNLVIAGVTAAVSQAAMAPVVNPLAEWVERQRMGLCQRLAGPTWVRDAVAVALLDWTLYWWHVAEHRIPWLYRFHQVHHADLELDATTALRFHFGEFLASVPWRAAQIVLIGASPRALRAWQRATMLSVLFHHSNLRLPPGLERRLARLIVTPRLHGIHHSVVLDEQDSNWSSGLTLWDRMHGTYRADVAQASIIIGVEGYQRPDDIMLTRSLMMPFQPLRTEPHGLTRSRKAARRPS